MRLILLLLALVAAGGCDRQKAEGQQGAAGAAEAEAGVAGVDRSHKGKALPDIAFSALGGGGQVDGESFRGRPLLVNLWATWCAPCVKELPSLNALAVSRKDLAVAAISQDMAPAGSVEAFLARLKLDDLDGYHDPKMALSGALGAQILPTSILYDANGREVWRYVGDLDWTGAEASALLAEAR